MENPTTTTTIFRYNDGGRAEAGFKGNAGDCVTRALTIATERPYREIYDRLAHGNATQRRSPTVKSASAGKRSARNGIFTTRKWFKDYMNELGFEWIPTMGIGTGCKIHLRYDELPKARLVVAVSKHYTTMIHHVIEDTYNPDRNGTRCVYGFWMLRS